MVLFQVAQHIVGRVIPRQRSMYAYNQDAGGSSDGYRHLKSVETGGRKPVVSANLDSGQAESSQVCEQPVGGRLKSRLRHFRFDAVKEVPKECGSQVAVQQPVLESILEAPASGLAQPGAVGIASGSARRSRTWPSQVPRCELRASCGRVPCGERLGRVIRTLVQHHGAEEPANGVLDPLGHHPRAHAPLRALTSVGGFAIRRVGVEPFAALAANEHSAQVAGENCRSPAGAIGTGLKDCDDGLPRGPVKDR